MTVPRVVGCLCGHNGKVESIVALPNGRCASGGMDNTIRIWNMASGDQVAALSGHAGSVNLLAALPDGRLASGSADRTVRIWDTLRQTQVLCFDSHRGKVLALSAIQRPRKVAGAGLIASSATDGSVFLWNTETGLVEVTIAQASDFWKKNCVMAFSAPTRDRLIGGITNGCLQVWDSMTGQEVTKLIGHSRVVTCLLTMKCGLLVSGSRDRSIKIWDLRSRQEIASLDSHTAGIVSLFTLPSGTLGSSSLDGKIKLWDIPRRRDVASVRIDKNSINAAAAHPEGYVLVAGQLSNSVKIWDMEMRNGISTWSAHEATVSALAALPNGWVVSGCSRGVVNVWDPMFRKKVGCLKGHEGSPITAIAPLPEGRVLTASADGTVKAWDIDRCSEVFRLFRYTTAIAVLPDGRLASGAASDPVIRLWSPNLAEEVGKIPGHSGTVTSIVYLPNAGRIASGSTDCTVKTWNIDAKTNFSTFRGHRGPVTGVGVFPNDGRLASSSVDGTIRVWDPDACAEVIQIWVHGLGVTALAVLANGWLATGSRDRIISVWTHSHSSFEDRPCSRSEATRYTVEDVRLRSPCPDAKSACTPDIALPGTPENNCQNDVSNQEASGNVFQQSQAEYEVALKIDQAEGPKLDNVRVQQEEN